MDRGAEVEGLNAAGFGVGEVGADGVEDGVVVPDLSADDEVARLFKGATDLLSAGDFACSHAAGVIGEEDEVAGEVGGVGAA